MTESPTPAVDATDEPVHNADIPGATPHRPLTDLERQVLQEVATRKAAGGAGAASFSEESGGPRGPEPTRYGDWERKGLAVDF